MIINAVIAIGLAPFVGWVAPAIATTVAGWTMLAQLYWGVRNMGDATQVDSRYKKRLPKIIVSAIIMGAAMWFISLLLTGLLETPYLRYVALIILLTVGFLSYFGMAQITGALRIKDLRQATKR